MKCLVTSIHVRKAYVTKIHYLGLTWKACESTLNFMSVCYVLLSVLCRTITTWKWSLGLIFQYSRSLCTMSLVVAIFKRSCLQQRKLWIYDLYFSQKCYILLVSSFFWLTWRTRIISKPSWLFSWRQYLWECVASHRLLAKTDIQARSPKKGWCVCCILGKMKRLRLTKHTWS